MNASQPDADSVRERDDFERLKLIAEKGTRNMILWELASDDRNFFGLDFVAQELGIEDRPLAYRVDAFVNDMADHFDNYAKFVDWNALGDEYGDVADAVIEAWEDDGGH